MWAQRALTDAALAEKICLLKRFPERLATFREKGFTVIGDVHPDTMQVAGAITPVPGGVGPLTIAMLMSNTVKACGMRRDKSLYARERAIAEHADVPPIKQ